MIVLGITAAGLLESSSVAGDNGKGNSGNANPGYVQVNLVSDIATNAPRTDSRLVNPWGILASPEAVWINDNGPGLTTVYGPQGQLSSFAIHIPAPGGGTGTPSGLIFNNTFRFIVTNGPHHLPSTFLMSTEDGTIAAWSQQLSGSNATLVVDNSGSGAVYKGLAIARDTNGTPNLYAANFHAGVIDMFGPQFQYLSSFTDSNLPPNFAPFNIRTIRGWLFVTFALQKLPDAHDDQAGAGNGFVDIFDTDGTMLRRVVSQGALNSPWGIVVAPSDFGKFANTLLVGNFGNGMINSYDLLTGKWLGNLADTKGNPIVIDGLWGLTFENEAGFEHEWEFSSQRLYFSAGINEESDGLFGYIRAANGHGASDH